MIITLYLRQRRLGLWEPEGHLHGPVHLHGRGQRGARLLLLARRSIQRAEAPVAVGLERAHAECVGQDEGLVVVGDSGLAFRGMAGCVPITHPRPDVTIPVP